MKKVKRGPNIARFFEDIVFIELTNKYKEHIGDAIVDANCYDEIKNIRWSFSSTTGYAVAIVDGKMTLLHNYILSRTNLEDGLFVDHINRIRLDNRKNNLRLVKGSDNHTNLTKRSDTTSDFIGVSWSQDRGKWVAQICVLGKNINLGRFSTVKEAAHKRLVAERNFFGEIASTHNLTLYEEIFGKFEE